VRVSGVVPAGEASEASRCWCMFCMFAAVLDAQLWLAHELCEGGGTVGCCVCKPAGLSADEAGKAAGAALCLLPPLSPSPALPQRCGRGTVEGGEGGPACCCVGCVAVAVLSWQMISV
jgi:hypothetical protein